MLKTAQVLRKFVYDKWGGTESVVWNSVPGLRTHNIDSEVLAAYMGVPHRFEVRDGVNIRRFPYHYPVLFLNAAGRAVLDRCGRSPVSPALCEYIQNSGFQLVHIHCDGILGASVAAAAARAGIPYIVSFHSGGDDSALCHAPSGIDYGALLALCRGWKNDFARRASGLVCERRDETSRMRSLYPGKRIITLPNGVNVDKFSTPVKNNFRAVYGIPDNRRMILCTSRLDPRKNQQLLVHLAASLVEEGENVQLVLIGTSDGGGYLEQLRELIDDLQIGHFVTLVPGLAPDDPMLVSAYQSADLFAVPSLRENFGMVVLEAWAAGVPVVASDAGGLKELVTDGCNGLLFHSNDLNDLCQTCRELLHRPELAASITEAGLREVRAHYSNEAVSAELAGFYRECVE